MNFFLNSIGFFYRNILKRFFFLFDPEFVHDRIIMWGKLFSKLPPSRFFMRKIFTYKNSVLEQNIQGIKFANPVGLSAGFDKNAELVSTLPLVGFGFQQVGSVTWNSYEGNPKPRLFRLKKSKGIVVYYGLKNIGTKSIVERVKAARAKNWISDFPLSFSVAKTNSKEAATDAEAIADYINSIKYIETENANAEKEKRPLIADFYTINISCPNTYGGEPFSTPDRFEMLAKQIFKLGITRPIFFKMPINIPWQDFSGMLDIIIKYKFSGVIIGNLNKDRTSDLIKDEIPENIKGGISGLPTKELSNELIKKTYKYVNQKLIIIGVGGIFSGKDAYEKIKLGASLVQLITGMIFEGPQLVAQINRDLVKLLKNDGYANISEAIGASHKM